MSQLVIVPIDPIGTIRVRVTAYSVSLASVSLDYTAEGPMVATLA